MALASMSFMSPRLIAVAVLVVALLALLVVAAVLLAGPHLFGFAHSLMHSTLAFGGASPMGCGSAPGSCY